MKKNLRTLAAAGVLLAAAPASAQLKTAFGTDIMLPTTGTEVYSNARMSVSYTGSIYVVRLVASSAAAAPQVWQLLKSTDNGISWTQIASSSISGTQKYTSIDVIAVGNSPATHRIFVARSSADTTAQTGNINFSSVDSLGGNASTQSLPAVVATTSPRGYTSVALASDTRGPNSFSATAGGYYIAVAAVKDGIAADSVVAWTKTANAPTYFRASVYGTASAQIRSVSASIGSCSAAITSLYGRLGIAWDEFASSTGVFGTSRVRFLFPDDATAPPYSGPYVLSGSGSTRRPQVVLSTDTLRSNIKAIVTYEFDGVGTDLNARTSDSIIGGTAAPSFTNLFTIADGSGDQLSGGASYDPAFDNFLFAYHNAATGALGYSVRPYSVTGAGAPTSVITNYRDASTALTDPFADLDINTTRNQAAFVWTDGSRTMFDAEYLLPNSVATPQTVQEVALFPNPATDRVTLRFRSATADASALYNVVDMAGRTVLTGAAPIQPGDNVLNISLGTLPGGVYTLSLRGAQTAAAVRFSVR